MAQTRYGALVTTAIYVHEKAEPGGDFVTLMTRAADVVKAAAALPRVPIHYPPGHFYSPIPSKDDIARVERPSSFAGIDLAEPAQLALVEEFAELPPLEPLPSWRYRFENGFFRHGDAFMYYAMLTTRRPKRVVEVGSGWSSALALDVTEGWAERPDFTFIEPNAERLRSLLRPGDPADVIEKPVQDVSVADLLEPGDFLFIDSSHVCKAGSDVNHLLFDVLPHLPVGVVVHVHDVYAGFEYPSNWLTEGRGWNEAYLLRAFLMHNDRWRVLVFNSWLGSAHRALVADRLPTFAQHPGGSLWMTNER